jgi:molybdopterin converting factor small subunit
MEVHLAVFGAFRDLVGAGEIRLRLPAGAAVADLRRALAQALAAKPEALALLACSAFADAEDILAEDDALAGRAGLAVLPPVSGG